MNCHGSNKNEGTKSNHNGMNHMLMMILCCALPIILIVLLPFLGFAPRIKIMLGLMVPFICPIMMVLMIPMMFMHLKGDKSSNETKDETILKITK